MTLREQLTDKVGKGHLSYSSIKYALGDMRLWEMYMKGQLKKESYALSFGSLYDMLLFERKKAMDTYMILDPNKVLENCSEKTIASKKPQLTSDYKEQKAILVKDHEDNGGIVCSSEDWEMANDMIQRLCLLYTSPSPRD